MSTTHETRKAVETLCKLHSVRHQLEGIHRGSLSNDELKLFETAMSRLSAIERRLRDTVNELEQG